MDVLAVVALRDGLWETPSQAETYVCNGLGCTGQLPKKTGMVILVNPFFN